MNLQFTEQILESAEWLNFTKDEREVHRSFDSPDNEKDILEKVKVETDSQLQNKETIILHDLKGNKEENYNGLLTYI